MISAIIEEKRLARNGKAEKSWRPGGQKNFVLYVMFSL